MVRLSYYGLSVFCHYSHYITVYQQPLFRPNFTQLITEDTEKTSQDTQASSISGSEKDNHPSHTIPSHLHST